MKRRKGMLTAILMIPVLIFSFAFAGLPQIGADSDPQSDKTIDEPTAEPVEEPIKEPVEEPEEEPEQEPTEVFFKVLDQETDKPLADAEFSIYQGSKAVIKSIKSSSRGEFSFEVSAENLGKSFKVKEVRSPKGYRIATKTISFTLVSPSEMIVDGQKISLGSDSSWSGTPIAIYYAKEAEESEEPEKDDSNQGGTYHWKIVLENKQGLPISDAVFTLNDLSSSARYKGETDDKGNLSFVLKKGHEYEFGERSVSKNYVPDGTIYHLYWEDGDLVILGERNLRIQGINPLVIVNERKDEYNQTEPETPEVTPGGDENYPLALNTVTRDAYLVGYDDGLMKPETKITRAEAAAILYRMMTPECREHYQDVNNSFSDVHFGDWFNKAVSTMANADVVKGYENGAFEPNRFVTRAEFATMMSSFASAQAKDNAFKDMAGHWANHAVAIANANGWISGHPDGSFRPDKNITRAEAATMMNRATQRAVKIDDMLPNMKTWPDNRESDWFYVQIQQAGNSYSYEKTNEKVPGEDYNYDKWIKILPSPLWN